MSINCLYVNEVKLFRLQSTACPGYRKSEEKQITFYWSTKERERLNLLSEALCTCISLFPFLWAKERNRKAERERHRERKINSGIKWQQTDHAAAEVPLNLPGAEVSFFFSTHFSFLFFFSSSAPPFPPEISFQRAKPCKNRPRVFKLRPDCKDVLACSAATGCCCSEQCLLRLNGLS